MKNDYEINWEKFFETLTPRKVFFGVDAYFEAEREKTSKDIVYPVVVNDCGVERSAWAIA